MADKLTEITERLYNEGLAKGKEEGDRLLAEATQKAATIIEEAESKAAAIVAEAEKKAADLKAKSESDIKMASAQCIQATRGDIENLLVNSVCSKYTAEAFRDPDFIKEIIRAVAAKFSTTEGCDIALSLPESLSGKIEPWLAGEFSGLIGKQVSASFTKKAAGGFTIGPKDGSWFISVTEESFNELIAEYLRPVTRKLLFGE